MTEHPQGLARNVCACVRISKRKKRVEACRPELFLAKPAKLCRNTFRRFATAAERLRFAVGELHTPKPLGRGLRLGISASTALKSNAYTKPPTTRCESRNDQGTNNAWLALPWVPAMTAEAACLRFEGSEPKRPIGASELLQLRVTPCCLPRLFSWFLL
jgi:hypothetical protein